MTTATSWMLAALWISVLALGELALLLALVYVARHYARIVAYLRSFVDDPNYTDHASMARACAGLAMLAALAIVCAMIRFAFTKDASVGMATVLAGALTTLLGTGVLGLLLRKKPDGSSETIDDVKPTKEHAAAQTTITVDAKAGQ
jgi:hypothetical protein